MTTVTLVVITVETLHGRLYMCIIAVSCRMFFMTQVVTSADIFCSDKRCIDGGVISKKPKESSIERESNQSVTVALFVQRLLSTGVLEISFAG